MVGRGRASLRGGLAALIGSLIALAAPGIGRAQAPDPLAQYRLAASNAGDDQLTGLYMRTAGTTAWGANLLTHPLGRDQKATLPPDPAMGCQRDLYARYASGAHSDKLNMDICAFATTTFAGPTVREAGSTLAITVKNVGVPMLIGFYIIPQSPGGTALGPNRLSGSLGKNQTARIPLDATHCVFDMEAMYAGTIREYRQGVNVCTLSDQSFAGPTTAPAPSPAPSPAPAPAPGPVATAPIGQPAPTDIYVVNDGKDDILRAVFRRTGTHEHPVNHLSAPLAPGQRVLVHLPPTAGCIYDVAVGYRHGGGSQQLGLNICGYSDAVFAAPEPGLAARSAPSSLTVRNARGPALRGFYLSPSNAQGRSFGPNRLAHPLEADQSISIPLPLAGEAPHCDYDMRAIYTSGAKEDRYKVNICAIGGQVFHGPTAAALSGTSHPGTPAGPTAGPTPSGGALSLDIRNDYRVPIVKLFISPSSARGWGANKLGANEMIAARMDMRFDLPAGSGCMYDVRAEFDNEVDQKIGHIDVCHTTQVSLTGGKPGALLSRGSGFYISRDGDILTNNHVVYGCKTVALLRDTGAPVAVRVEGQDARDDLAILKEDGVTTAPLRFRAPDLRLAGGEPATALGYPLSFELGAQLKISSGYVSATEVAGAPAQFQIQTPINPGNSGGPVLDGTGRVIGISVAQLRPDKAENVNFAVRGEIAQRLARSLGVKIEIAPPGPPVTPQDIYATDGPSVVPVECFN